MGRDDIMSEYDYVSPTSPTGTTPFSRQHQSLGGATSPQTSPNDPRNVEFGQQQQQSKDNYGGPPFGYGTGSSASRYSMGSVGYADGGRDVRSDNSHEPLHADGSYDPVTVGSGNNSASLTPRGSPGVRNALLPRAGGLGRDRSTYSIYSEALIPVPRPIQAPIPAGYALCQLLPSRMLRLTLRLPKPFRWAPGQNVLLQIREISIWTSHPFSIVSVYDEDVEQEIVLLVKARKGFTLDLWKETKRRMEEGPQHDAGHQENGLGTPGIASNDRPQSYYFASSSKKLSTPKPVFFRALVDGPYGSSARVRWGDHSTVLIICGGSGVSFGIAILTYVCECIASRDKMGMGRGGKGGRHFITRRVRFLWIVRDFGEWQSLLLRGSPSRLLIQTSRFLLPLPAEVLWVSNLIRRCMDMIPPEQLVIDIFVTNYRQSEKSVYMSRANLEDELAPPKPMFAKGSRSRSNSRDSISSAISNDSNTDLAYLQDRGDADADGDQRDSVLELTNWDEEQDEEEHDRTFAERQLSINVKKEGRIRRAKSRKRAETKKARLTPAQLKERYGDSSETGAAAPPLPSGVSSLHPLPSSRPTGPSPSPSYNDNLGATTDYSQHEKQSPAFISTPLRSVSQQDDLLAAQSPPSAFNPSKRFSVASSMTAESFNQDQPISFGHFGQAQRGRSGSVTPGTAADSLFGDNASYLGGASESTRGLVGGAWDDNRQSFVRQNVEGEDQKQFIDGEDEEDLNLVSELARPGRPKLEKIIGEEVEMAEGTIGIACESDAISCLSDVSFHSELTRKPLLVRTPPACGPASLNAAVRNVSFLDLYRPSDQAFDADFLLS